MLEEKGAKTMRGRNPEKIRQKPRIFSVLLSISAQVNCGCCARPSFIFPDEHLQLVVTSRCSSLSIQIIYTSFSVVVHCVKLANPRRENFWSLNLFFLSFFAGQLLGFDVSNFCTAFEIALWSALICR
jgi:hypothetical protein